MTINKVFEKVLVLNLNRRPDRLARVTVQAQPHQILFERFPALDGRDHAIAAEWRAYAARPLVRPPTDGRPVRTWRQFYLDHDSHEARVAFWEQMNQKKAIVSPGAWGLLRSQIAILRAAIAAGWESLLVLEDDVLFHKDTPELFARFMAQAPSDWKIIQLGALQLHWEANWITWHSENLYRCNGSGLGAHAVGMRREVFPLLLREAERMDLPYDVGPLPAIKRLCPARCLIMFPNVVIQDAADSEIASSTIFFREARKQDNVYRWNLADYGPGVGGKEQATMTVAGRPSLQEGQSGDRLVGDNETSDATARGQRGTISDALRSDAGFRLPDGFLTVLRRLRRVRPNGAAAEPAPEAPSPASLGTAWRGWDAPLVPFARKGATETRVIAVAVFGLGPTELDRVIDVVSGYSAKAGLVPLFLTDNPDFDPFRSRRLLFEYFPAPEIGAQLLGSGMDWDLYRQRRFALFRRKWQPIQIIGFGAKAGEVLATWRVSPFEDETIGTVLSATSPPSSGR